MKCPHCQENLNLLWVPRPGRELAPEAADKYTVFWSCEGCARSFTTQQLPRPVRSEKPLINVRHYPY